MPTLLAIDDDPTQMPLLKAALSDNYAVHVEQTGAFAVARALELRPELILLDLHLPNIDGFEILRQLQLHPVTAMIPVICMSGDLRQETRTRAHHLGALGVLCKPLELESLGSVIQGVIGSANTSIESADGRRKFTFSWSASQRQKLVEKEIKETLFRNSQSSQRLKTVVISCRSGEEFFGSLGPKKDELLTALETQALVYLQCRPSLVRKIPYLDSLTPVIEEMSDLADAANTQKLALIWDNPDWVLDRSLVHLFRESITQRVDWVHLICARESEPSKRALFNDVAHSFVL